MFSSLVISLIIIITGGGSSFVFHFSYWTVLISTRGSYILSILLPIPPGVGGGRRGVVSERLHDSDLLAGLKPRQFFVAPNVGHKGLR